MAAEKKGPFSLTEAVTLMINNSNKESWPLGDLWPDENLALWLAEQTDLQRGGDGSSGGSAAARTLRWSRTLRGSRILLRLRSGLWARQVGAAARAEPRRSAQVRRLLGASSGAPRHALQRLDVREPEPDSAEIHHVSPEQVRRTEAVQVMQLESMNRNELKLHIMSCTENDTQGEVLPEKSAIHNLGYSRGSVKLNSVRRSNDSWTVVKDREAENLKCFRHLNEWSVIKTVAD